MSIDPKHDYTALQTLLDEAAAFLDWPEDSMFTVLSEISGWSIGQQLYHVTLANASIPRLIERLQKGTIGNTEDEPIPDKIAIILEGYIPEGRKAPARVVPPTDLDLPLLTKDFSRMRKATQRLAPQLDALDQATHRFPHMFFGPMTAIEWVRFMHIHTKHHMRIVERLATQLSG